MAREILIKTWCDVCMKDNDHTEPRRIEAEFSGDVTVGTASRHIDLCSQHEQMIIGDLVEQLQRFGSPVGAGSGQTDSDGRHSCPIQGCTKVYSHRNSLAGHLRKVHGQSISDYVDDDDRYSCSVPGCDSVATSSQGRAAHERIRHGILGKSQATIRARERVINNSQ